MRIRWVLALMIFFQGAMGQSILRIDGSTLEASDLDKRVEYLIQAAKVSGVAVTVYRDLQPVYSRAFGLADVPKRKPLTQQSALYAASFAKTVFAYVAMQFVEEGMIDLDKPLVDYLSRDLTDYTIPGYNRGYKDLKGDDRYKRITARMCLTHTTGFPNWRWFEADKKLKFKADPGTRYGYSGEGMYLLQFVMEQVSGKDYETICRERVFIPLQMTRTSMIWQDAFNTDLVYGHNAAGIPYELVKWNEAVGAGSMTTTPADFTKFFTAFINQRGLTDSSFIRMTSTQVRIRSRSQFGPLSRVDSTDNDAIQLGYGLGVGVFHTPFGRAFFKEGHDDGWGHYSICYPDKGVAITIMTNNDNGESIFKELLAYAIGDVYTPWQWENYIPYDK